MYITVHAAAGAAIGQHISPAILAFTAGFLSHLILDIIPHGDEWIENWPWFRTKMQRLFAISLIDLVAVAVMTVVWINHSNIAYMPSMLAGIAGAIAPDALWGFYELTKTPLLLWYTKIHSDGHHIVFKTKLTMLQGGLVQGAVLAILTWIIVK